MNDEINWPDWQTLPWNHTARNENRRMVLVDVEPMSTSVAGEHTPRGKHFRLVYESDLPLVFSRVQTDAHRAHLRTAQSQFQAALEEEAKRHGGNLEEARKTITESVESFYCKLPGCKTGRPPLLSVVVCPEVIPPPVTPATQMAVQAKSMEGAISGGLEKAFEKFFQAFAAAQQQAPTKSK